MAAPSNDTGKSQERCHKNMGRGQSSGLMAKMTVRDRNFSQ